MAMNWCEYSNHCVQIACLTPQRSGVIGKRSPFEDHFIFGAGSRVDANFKNFNQGERLVSSNSAQGLGLCMLEQLFILHGFLGDKSSGFDFPWFEFSIWAGFGSFYSTIDPMKVNSLH